MAAPPAVLPPPVLPPPRSLRRRPWIAWLTAAASVSLAVPTLLLPLHREGDHQALHAVAGISDQAWSAEFVDDHGVPARWDPCTPIHYVVDLAYAPAGALNDVDEAFARLAQATGMTFVDDGLRQERPMRDRAAYQPDAYGDRWAPVLVSWSLPAQTDLLGDEHAEAVTVPIALAGSSSGGSIVTAEVVLNAARQLPVGFGPGPSEGEVLMHELGHAVGLGHVSSRSEAMYPAVRGIAGYGSGDLAGLDTLGRPSGCHPAPAAHPLRRSAD